MKLNSIDGICELEHDQLVNVTGGSVLTCIAAFIMGVHLTASILTYIFD